MHQSRYMDKKINLINSFFEQSDYNLHALQSGAISVPSQEEITLILSGHQLHNGIILDVCCGSAWLPIRLANENHEINRIILLDFSKNQIFIAKENINTFLCRHDCHVHFINSDIKKLPFDNVFFDIITWSCAIHLFSPQEIEAIGFELAKITTTDARLAIITFDYRDIGQSLCDKYINGYTKLDLKRYYTAHQIEKIFRRSPWTKCNIYRQTNTQIYSKYSEVERLFYSKPYSTFSLLENMIGSVELDKRIKNGLRKIRADFGDNPISFQQTSTTLVLSKK